MDLCLLPLGFSLILTLASTLLHPYIRDDKTSRSMVKRFSTVRDTQGGSQRYMEKRRREIKVTRRTRQGVKRGERNLASNQLRMCSPQSGTNHPERFTEKRRGRTDRGDLEEKRECQQGRGQSSQ